jgi:hypothetical protein
VERGYCLLVFLDVRALVLLEMLLLLGFSCSCTYRLHVLLELSARKATVYLLLYSYSRIDLVHVGYTHTYQTPSTPVKSRQIERNQDHSHLLDITELPPIYCATLQLLNPCVMVARLLQEHGCHVLCLEKSRAIKVD